MQNVYETIMSEKKKKKSVGFKMGIAVLILLLVPILLAGMLYLYVTFADYRYDDPRQVIASSKPMSFAQRSSFDAENRTRTMRIDNSDLYFMTADIIPDLHFNESLYINAYRIALEDSAIYLQGKAYGINVPLKVTVATALEGGEINVRILGAYLGKLNIPLPIGWAVKKWNIDLEYAFPAGDVHLLKNAQSMAIKDGYLQLVYPVDKNFFTEGFAAWSYLRPASFYIGENDQRIMLISDYKEHWEETGYVSERVDAFIKKFSENPDEFMDLWQWMLAAAPENELIYYFDSDDYDEQTNRRFYPDITRNAILERKETLPYEKNYDALRYFLMTIDGKFGERKITIRDRQFVSMETKAVLSLSDLAEGDPMVAEFFPEGGAFCAIFCEGADAKQKIGTGIYSCGTAVKYPSGRCAVLCIKKEVMTIVEIPPEEYEALASGEKSGFVVAIIDK